MHRLNSVDNWTRRCGDKYAERTERSNSASDLPLQQRDAVSDHHEILCKPPALLECSLDRQATNMKKVAHELGTVG